MSIEPNPVIYRALHTHLRYFSRICGDREMADHTSEKSSGTSLDRYVRNGGVLL
jgi:hypothetical protein